MNAPAKQPHPLVVFKDQLDTRMDQFRAALPAHMPPERFARVVLTAVQNNPELLNVDRQSLWNACMRAAQDGLLPDGREGAMVVRSDRDKGKVANWQPMIAGVRKKARNSGEIATWDAHIVCEGDTFDCQLGDDPQVNHRYDLRAERGKIIGAYSVCSLKDGQKSFEVMTISEIHKIRDRSDAWKAYKAGKIKTTPWLTDEGEMCRKTVARRHSKVLPMSSDLDDLIRRDDDLYDFDNAKKPAQLIDLDAIGTDERPQGPRPAPPQSTQENGTHSPGGGGSAGADAPKADGATGGEPDAPPAETASGAHTADDDAPPTELESTVANSLIDCRTPDDVDAVGKMFHDDIKAAPKAVQDAIMQQFANVREAMAKRGDLFPGDQ